MAEQCVARRFFTNRIGSSMLMQHHMGLREKPRHEGYVGTIALECNLHEIIHDAVDHASSLFVAQHGFAPHVCIPIATLDNAVAICGWLHDSTATTTG